MAVCNRTKCRTHALQSCTGTSFVGPSAVTKLITTSSLRKSASSSSCVPEPHVFTIQFAQPARHLSYEVSCFGPSVSNIVSESNSTVAAEDADMENN